MCEAYSENMKYDQDMMFTQAWVTAVWSRTKKIEPLEKILGRKKNKKVMTDDQMMRQCIALNKLFGGEVISDGNTQSTS